MDQKKKPIHFLFIAAYFVLTLFDQNFSQIFPRDVVRPILIILLLTVFAFFLILVVIKDWERSAALLSIFILTFFSYGALYALLKSTFLVEVGIARHRFLLPFSIGLWLVLSYFIYKAESREKILTRIFNTLGIALLIMPILSLGLKVNATNPQFDKTDKRDEAAQVINASDDYPDIYYIITDAYGRQDYLMEEYEFDNSDFIDWLQEVGFYVVDCARSNYAHTMLSLSSSLMMEYVPEFASDSEYYDGGMNDYIVHNEVRDRLENLGYTIITFESVYWDYSDADIFYTFEYSLFSPYLRPFESLLISNSMLKAFIELKDENESFFSSLTSSPVIEQYLKQNYIIDTLEEKIPQIEGPKFVFVHIEVPHGPYVFDSNGAFQKEDAFYRGEYFSAINSEYGDIGYINQVQFINSRFKEIIPLLQKDTEIPPVIIIQGDHSIEEFGKEEDRLKVLSAIFLPERDYSSMYPSLSLINTYPIVFNAIFNEEIPLLEDQGYFSWRSDRFNWEKIPEELLDCQNED